MIPDTDKAVHCRTVFEGSIYFARRPERKKKHNGKGYRIANAQRISMEVKL